MMLGFFGSIVTVPIENEPWLSKIGVKLVPPLTVFHTPPAAAPMYQTFLLVGSTAMSATRPEVSAGPIERSFSPDTAVGRRVVSAAGVDWAPRVVAQATTKENTKARMEGQG